ncbi:S9 family peptidase [Cellulomonas sp. SLBN-39]|uniref:alpha/beta hydrolase family protein n=1 Tax=Cellulomonas sp. SLBN-39 TaxID=2768446 RepID=UPI001150D9BD|nr:hypothetical protein [Cellulomonas sp. SLBN-39]TQL03619.1 hypothetical protein FBY24_2720 [Cellulomonas sp. SLBN-39]
MLPSTTPAPSAARTTSAPTRRARPAVGALAAVLALAALTACSSDTPPDPEAVPTSATTTLAAAPVELTPTDPDACLAEGVAAADVGEDLAATHVAWAGSGTRGVVLSPQDGGDVCQWADELVRLASQGYLVATFTWGGAAEESVRGAVDVLRAAGAQDVALVGASMGGAWSAALAQDLDAAAVVALSPPAAFGDLDATAASHGYTGPIVVVASADDGDVPAAQSMQVAPLDDPDAYVELSGSAHGVALLDGEHADQVRDIIDETLAAGFGG